MKFLESIIDFFKNMRLESATLIALIFVSINFLYYVGNLLGLYYGGLFTTVLAQGSLVIFFAVLYLKQKGE